MKKAMMTCGLALLAQLVCGQAQDDWAAWVDPFVGTAGTGHTFPAACVPFGMVQAGPDTGAGDWAYCSGYQYADKDIYGFSQTHLNGTGDTDLGDVLLVPFPAEKARKAEEVASPGFYGVTFPDYQVKTEVTATEHVGFYRFTSLTNENLKLTVDCQWGHGDGTTIPTHMLGHDAQLEADGFFTGRLNTKGFNPSRTVYFAVAFNHKIAKMTTLPKRDEREKGARYAFEFEDDGLPLKVKVGLSRNSTFEAKANLVTELPDWDFDSIQKQAREKWNALFARSEVEGTEEQKKNFYTSLYHLYIQPNNIADAGKKPFYTIISCWDTFRAANPLYTILTPDYEEGIVDSLLEFGHKNGYLPIWPLWDYETQAMIGTHSIPIIVDWFLKNPDKPSRAYWLTAFTQMRNTLRKMHPERRKERWDLLDKYGYYPFDLIRGESVSRTMECAYDDACAARMAEKLGLTMDAAFFAKRAQNWKNVFDPEMKMVRGKDTKGNWRTPYNPFEVGHNTDTPNDFTEGNAFQYTWHVMQDAPGLIAAMGGPEEFTKRLDALFVAPTKVEGQGTVVDMTGLIGQYAHGNEPSHHIIYFYTLAGHPEKAAERIREVCDKFYLPKPDGLCGNDDCGQMSAWYIFSAMGFYPFDPCGGDYVLGAPQVAKVTLNLTNGNTFTITAKNLSKENKYVKAVYLNGEPLEGCILKHAQILAGGTLEFDMTNEKETK